MTEKPVWATPIGRRPLLLAAGAAGIAAALPSSPARAATRAAASAVDAITTGSWLAGDTHVHCDHSSDGSFVRQVVSQQGPGTLSVADQIGEGERMGLHWMPLTDHRTYDQHWDPQWTSSKLLLVPGEEANGSPHATVLGAVDVIVDGARPKGSAAHRHLQQSIWEAHAQGASWGTAHPGDTNPENDSVVGASTVECWNRASEADVDVDWAESSWNKGFRFGPAGACDCHFKELWGIAGPGMPTTWVLATSQTERAVLDALRAGRTTLSSTPVGAFVTLEADADGDGVFEAVGGDEVVATSTVKLRVRAQRAVGMTLYVYEAPGRSATPVERRVVTTPDETLTLDVPMRGTHHWWRAELRGYGPPSGLTTDPAADVPKSPDQLQAMTSPVFATTGAPAVPEPAIPLPPVSGAATGVLLDLGGTTWHGFPDVAVGPAGQHVVAEEHGPGRTAVVYRAPTGRRTVLADGAARQPKVAAAGDDVWVAYQDEATQLPRTPQVFLAHSSDGGLTFDAPRRLSDGRGRQERPAIALLPDGRPVVAWQAATGSAVEVLVWVSGDAAPAVVSLPGKVITPPNGYDSRSARYPASLFPDLAVLPDAVVVCWQDNRNDPDPLWTGHFVPARTVTDFPQDNDPSKTLPDLSEPATDPDTWEPMVSVRRLDGSAWSAPVRVAPRDDRAQCHPALGAAADGTLVCAWDSRLLQSSGTSPVITAATSNDGGRTWSAPVAVDEAPGFFAQRPRLAADPDGTMRMVWYDARGDDWRWAVRSAVLGDNGWQPVGEVLRGSNCTWPAVDSGVVVAATDRAPQAQREHRQDIVLADVAGAPTTDVPEIPLPVALPVAAAVVAGVIARARNRTADTPTGP